MSQTKTNIKSYCLYVESKKNGTNELIYKTNGVTDVENIDSQFCHTNLEMKSIMVKVGHLLKM